ncbi:hypothetical protein VE00_09186 [Pseudogymnoascus sp. WSF 3629]|nr:hypothetical protein VE00_09186 [Pseudogymnoascus sp. WSF 3629]
MSTSTSSSYVFPSEQWSTPATAADAHDELASDNDDLDSLPSSIDSSEESSEYSSDAQKEWEASLQQIELLLTMVVVPLKILQAAAPDSNGKESWATIEAEASTAGITGEMAIVEQQVKDSREEMADVIEEHGAAAGSEMAVNSAAAE